MLESTLPDTQRSALDAEFGSSPVSSLGVVSDVVVGLESVPVWQRSVLLSCSSCLLLDSQRLDRTHLSLIIIGTLA
jgi:hypothetical protein